MRLGEHSDNKELLLVSLSCNPGQVYWGMLATSTEVGDVAMQHAAPHANTKIQIITWWCCKISPHNPFPCLAHFPTRL